MAGGDIYLISLSSIQTNETTFQDSRALNGSVIFAESLLNKKIFMNSTTISYTTSPDPEMILIQTMSGSFVFNNSNLFGINSPIFQFNGTTAELDNVYGEYITCRTETQPFCLVSAKSSSFISRNMQIRFTNSLQDLFLFQSCANVSFYRLSIAFVNIGSGLLRTEYDSSKLIRKDNRQLFGLRLRTIQTISIMKSTFSRFNMTAMRVRKSNITIQDNLFTNADSLGVTFLDTPEIIELGVDKIKYVVMETCNSSIINSNFENSFLSGESNGGVILIILASR